MDFAPVRRMTRALRVIPVVCAGLILAASAACTSSSSSTPTSPTELNLTGNWGTNMTIAGITGRMTWALTQSGTSVTGPVTVAVPTGTVLLNGFLTGTLTGSSLTYSIAVGPGGIPLQPSCSGQLTGTMAATATTLTGPMNLVSTTCTVPIATQSLTLTKQ